LSLLSDLNSVGELYTVDDFRQLVMSVETTPAFFGGLSELEDHRERGLVRETSLGSHREVIGATDTAFIRQVRCGLVLPRAFTKSGSLSLP
jgi:hypothetical protein